MGELQCLRCSKYKVNIDINRYLFAKSMIINFYPDADINIINQFQLWIENPNHKCITILELFNIVNHLMVHHDIDGYHIYHCKGETRKIILTNDNYKYYSYNQMLDYDITTHFNQKGIALLKSYYQFAIKIDMIWKLR